MRWRLVTLLLACLIVACHGAPPEIVSDAGAPRDASVDSPRTLPADVLPGTRALIEHRAAQIAARRKTSSTGRPADPRVIGCMGKSSKWKDLKACLSQAPLPTIDAGVRLAFTSSPVPESNTSWLVPHWEWNVSTGSNDNTCVDAGHPCHDEGEILRRWGTRTPVLLQATELVNQVNDATEVVLIDPVIGPGGSITYIAPKTTVLTGTLGTTTAKDRTRGGSGTFSCPSATLCPYLQTTWTGISSTHAGDMIINSTHPGVAWVHKVVGTTAIITQPFVENVPTFATFPAEVDSWTTGDAFTLVTPKQTQIGSINPTVATGDSGGDAYFCFVGNVWATDQSGSPGNTYANISRLCRVTESRIDAYYTPASVSGGFDGAIQNSWMPTIGELLNIGGIQGGAVGNGVTGGAITFSGIADGDIIFDANVIIEQGSSNVANIIGYVSFNDVSASGGVQVDGDIAIVGDAYGGNGVVYGKALFSQVSTTASFAYLDTVANTFLGSQSLQCQLAAFANAVDRTVNPEQWYGPRALTVAALGTSVASGGFGDAAYCDSGASFHRLAQSSAAPADLCPEAGAFMTGKVAGPCGIPAGGSGGAVSSVTGSGPGIAVIPTTGNALVFNLGVTSAVAGAGISVSGASGAVTISNAGVRSLTAGTGIGLSGSTGAVTISNTGASFSAGGDLSGSTSSQQVTALTGSSGTLDIRTSVAHLSFDDRGASFNDFIDNGAKGSDTPTQTLTIEGQNCFSGASSNTRGGQINIQAGSAPTGASPSTIQMAGSDNVGSTGAGLISILTGVNGGAGLAELQIGAGSIGGSGAAGKPWSWTPTNISVSGGSTTLSAAQYVHPLINVAGTLVSNETIIFPNIPGYWLVNLGPLNLVTFTVTFQSGAALTGGLAPAAVTATKDVFGLVTGGSDTIAIQ